MRMEWGCRNISRTQWRKQCPNSTPELRLSSSISNTAQVYWPWSWPNVQRVSVIKWAVKIHWIIKIHYIIKILDRFKPTDFRSSVSIMHKVVQRKHKTGLSRSVSPHFLWIQVSSRCLPRHHWTLNWRSWIKGQIRGHQPKTLPCHVHRPHPLFCTSLPSISSQFHLHIIQNKEYINMLRILRVILTISTFP